MNRKAILLVLAIAALVLISFWSTHRSQPPTSAETKPLPGQNPLSQDSTVSQPTPPAPVSSASAKAARPDRKASSASRPEEKSMEFKPDEVVATVNGVPITGLDLVPLNSADPNAKFNLSKDMYQYLLDRAIVRELAVQEAKREGIALTPSQHQQLENQREKLRKTEDAEDAAGAIAHLNRTGTLQDQIEFQVRDNAAFFLLSALMDKAGVTPMLPSNVHVQEYYNAHAAEYGALPNDPDQKAAAWNQIYNDISMKLQPAILQAHGEERVQYIDQLKASAQITTNRPSS